MAELQVSTAGNGDDGARGGRPSVRRALVLLIRVVFGLVLAVVSQSLAWTSAQAEVASLALGQPCGSNGQCKSGACDLGGPAPSKTCVPVNNTGLAGQYCRDDAHCKGALICDARGDQPKCGNPSGELGESCWIYGRLDIVVLNEIHIQQTKTHCKLTRCDWNSFTCIPNDGTGQTGNYCTHHNHCKSGNCIDFKCTAANVQAVGDKCGSNQSCKSGICDTANESRCVAVAGSGPVGTYCSNNNQCASGLCLGSKCVATEPTKQAAGTLCATNAGCLSGVCDVANGPAKRCIPANGTGASGEYCSHDNQCKTVGCFANKCSKPIAHAVPLGKQCNTNADCSSGACDVGGPAPTRTCVPLKNTGLAGQYCRDDAHCKGNLVCDFRGEEPKCAAPFGELGESCFIYGRLGIVGLNEIHIQENKTHCKSLRCDWNSFTCIPNDGEGKVGDYCTHVNHCKNKNCVGFHCVAAAGLGQSCETNASCTSGACDTAKKKCVPLNGTGNTGEFCTASSHCKSNSCKTGTCESKAALGQYCGGGRICESSRCDNFNERKCIPNDGTGNKGDYCTHNNQCKSKNCPVPAAGKGTTCH